MKFLSPLALAKVGNDLSTMKDSGKIADYCEAEVLTDMAHFAGLLASGVHPSSMPMWSLRQPLKICADSVEGWSCPRKPIWKESPTMLFFMASGFWSWMQLWPRMSRWSSETRFRRICMPGRGQCLGPGKNPFWKQDWRHHCRQRHPSDIDGFAEFSVDLTTGLGCPLNLRLDLQKNSVSVETQHLQITSELRLGASEWATWEFEEKEFTMSGEWIAEVHIPL